MLLAALLFPLLLLGLLMLMARVERPLAERLDSNALVDFLDRAGPDELEAWVSEGLRPALDRYWRRYRSAQLSHRTG